MTPAGDISNPRRRGGFTLMELIVVISLMVILIAMAVPTFRLLSGNRSTENAGNVIGAMLARARADAVGLQEVRGVVVYKDRTTGRMASAFVLEKKTPFDAFVDGSPGTPVDYVLGQYVTQAANHFVCVQTHTDNSTSIDTSDLDYWRPLNVNQYNAATSNGGPYTAPTGMILDAVPDRDRQYLSKGIGVRGAGDNLNVNSVGNYRYYSPMVVLFDGTGALVSRPYYVLTDGLLGVDIDPNIVPNRQAGTPTPTPLGLTPVVSYAESQIGFVMFDEETFLNATAGFSGSPAQVDNWLDENATPVLVNRYNGTLIKGD